MEDGRSFTDHLCNFAAGPLDEYHLVQESIGSKSTMWSVRYVSIQKAETGFRWALHERGRITRSKSNRT